MPPTTAPPGSLRPRPDLGTAALRIVRNALEIKANERVLVVCDHAHEAFGDAIMTAIKDAGGAGLRFDLEALGARPHEHLAPSVLDALSAVKASILVCNFHGGEYTMRLELVSEVERLGIRHAHLVGLSDKAIAAGFAADPKQIEALSSAVLARMKPQSILRVRSASGTNLTVRLDPKHAWINHSGPIRAGTKENLPGGELVTCPAEVSGKYVANGTLGDAAGSFAGSLTKGALVLHVEGGVVKRIEGSDGILARRLMVAMRGVKNLDRVALVSLGTNLGMTEPVGEIFVDQTLPSFHLSLGVTFPERTLASWSSERWIAFTATASDVEVDGVPLLRSGRYVIDAP